MKERLPGITARKPPQQPRSRVTVEAILDGAIRVLEQESSLALTTTRIAQAAGDSVSTLYQYFPIRKCIVDALQEPPPAPEPPPALPSAIGLGSSLPQPSAQAPTTSEA